MEYRLWFCGLIVLSLALAGCEDADGSQNNASSQDAGPTSDASSDDGGHQDDDGGHQDDDDGGHQDDDGGHQDDDGGDHDGGGDGECIPSEETWERHAASIVEEYCGECHGEEPDFGAPYSLVDYDELVEGEPGERRVDKMAERLLDGTMPPPTEPQLGHDDLDTLVGWTTCGEEHADHSGGLKASEPIWEAPDDPPAGTEHFDVTADDFEIDVDTIDHYQCFVVEAPVDTERFIRRFEPVIDESRVLHHLLVSIDRSGRDLDDSFSCGGFPPGDSYVYVWAPGLSPIEFDDGGLRIEPGDRFVLQIHYNNGAGLEDVRDSSGFRVYHDAPAGTEWGLGAVGTANIYVPAESTASAENDCEVQRDVTIRASWPHMHEIGSEFETIIERKDGTEETLIELTGWSFEAQYFYDTPVDLEAGDRLETTCTYDNPHDHAVTFGEGTGDEMCFNFMYIDPPIESPCQ